MKEKLITLEMKSSQMFKLIIDDESFIDDIIEDLEKFLKLKIIQKNNSIGIVVNLDLSWDLQYEIVKKFIAYFDELVYLCDCGKYEYILNKIYCECGREICHDCKVFDDFSEKEICMNCMEDYNNEELGELI